MLWTRDLLREVLDDERSFRLLCSLAAAAEARNGRESGRIAALVPEGRRDLAPGMARHGAQQERHARLLGALSARRGLEPIGVPPDTDHALLLERRGGCPAHVKLRLGEPLNERDVIAHLAHAHVAESRAAAWLAVLAEHAADRPGARGPVREISRAKREHLAYCREGLLRFARAGHGAAVQLVLRENALAEVRVHRDVGLAVLARTGRLLGWRMSRSVALEACVQALYAYERLAGWRRTAHLVPPERAVPPGPPPETPAEPRPETPPEGAATASRGA